MNPSGRKAEAGPAALQRRSSPSALARVLVCVTCLVLAGRAQLLAQARCADSWTLRETLRIGSVDGPDALATVLDFDVSADGHVYVAQSFVNSISVFAPDGTPRRSIGRAGDGPGEFAVSPVRLGWWRDTLWVADIRAIHFFNQDGRAARQVRFSTPMPQDGSRFTPGMPLADGSFLGFRGITGDVARFFEAPELPVRRFSAAGRAIGTIASIPQRLFVKMDQGGFAAHPLGESGGPREALELPFAVTPDGSAILFVGDVREDRRGSTFELLKVGLTGDTVLKMSVAYSSRPVSRSEADWFTDAFAGFMADDYSSGRNSSQLSDSERERRRREAREALSYPRYYPPVRRIIAGHDGSIWLLRGINLPDLTDRWEVYDRAGRLEGVVNVAEGRSSQLPWHPRLKVFRATRQEVWGTTMDELDVTYIHRYAVEKGC